MAQTVDLATVRKFGNMEFLARQLVEGFITGLHKSPYHGFSVEFSEHRLYNSGESTRHIDWKVYARTDKLFVKRYEEETNLRCHLLLDVSPSMYYPEETNGKLTISAMAAAGDRRLHIHFVRRAVQATENAAGGLVRHLARRTIGPGRNTPSACRHVQCPGRCCLLLD